MQHGQAGGQIGAGRAENDIIPVIFRHFQQAFNGGFIVPFCRIKSATVVGSLGKLQVGKIEAMVELARIGIPFEHLLFCTAHFKAQTHKECPCSLVLIVDAEFLDLLQQLHAPLDLAPTDMVQCRDQRNAHLRIFHESRLQNRTEGLPVYLPALL